MVSHKNYHLNANEDFFISLTSKLITYFIDGFTLGMKSKIISYVLSGSEHIIILIILIIVYSPTGRATFSGWVQKILWDCPRVVGCGPWPLSCHGIPSFKRLLGVL